MFLFHQKIHLRFCTIILHATIQDNLAMSLVFVLQHTTFVRSFVNAVWIVSLTIIFYYLI